MDSMQKTAVGLVILLNNMANKQLEEKILILEKRIEELEKRPNFINVPIPYPVYPTYPQYPQIPPYPTYPTFC